MSEIKGKVLKVLPKESGVSKAGKEWANQSFVIETEGQYPKKVCFQASGKALEYAEKLQVEDEVEVSYNLESSEYNGKWYTKATAYSIKAEKKTPLSKEQKYNVDKVVNALDLTSEDDSLPF